MDHSQNTTPTLEERVCAWIHKIEEHLEVVKRLDIRDRGLSQTVASLVASVSLVKAEISQIERSEQPEVVARYVAMHALPLLLYDTVLELQIAAYVLKEGQPLLSSDDIDSLVEVVLRPVLKCRTN